MSSKACNVTWRHSLRAHRLLRKLSPEQQRHQQLQRQLQRSVQTSSLQSKGLDSGGICFSSVHSSQRLKRPCRALSTKNDVPTSTRASEDSAIVTTDSTAEGDVTTYSNIDFEINSKIEGEESQVITVLLKPGECVRAESGSMIFMTEGVQMNTTLSGASNAFKRMMTGQNVFLTDFTYQPGTSGKESGELCLGTDFPSKIVRLNLQDMANETLICQRGAYLASNTTVNIDMEFTKSLSAGFFGGQGFVLQKLTGAGDVLVKAGGTLVVKELQAGQKLRVTSGSIVAFENSVDYDVQMMPGIKNAMFGGEGLFVTTLTGPGRVWLQGMPADRMISEIARRVPGPGIGLGIPIGMGGGGGGDGEGDDGSAVGDEAAVAGAGAGGDVDPSEDMEERVAATDAAVDADRQATVASSGMMQNDDEVDADSPSSLFGDAAPEQAASSPPDLDDASFASSSDDTSFMGNNGGFSSNEPTFDDGDFSSEEFTQEDEFGDSNFMDDSTTTDLGNDTTSGEEGGGILDTLWDLFMGDD